MSKYHKRYDWKLLQAEYDSGMSQKDLCVKYGVCVASLYKAKSRGEISFRTPSEAQRLHQLNHKRPAPSEETRRKISESQIRYYEANPSKIPYRLYHSSKRSYPEQAFEKALKENGVVGWETEYAFGMYSFDFAWPECRLDVEIDGDTHRQDKVKKIDARRDAVAVGHGWEVVRIPAKAVREDVMACVNLVLEKLALPIVEYEKPIKPERKKYSCLECQTEIVIGAKRCAPCQARRNRKVERPSLEVLMNELKTTSYVSVGKKYGVSDNAIRKWIRSYSKM